MVASTSTRTTRRKPAATKAAATRKASAVKRSNATAAKADTTPAKPRTTRKRATGTRKPAAKKAPVTRRGGGAALKDFGNDWIVKVLKRAEIPSRRETFKSGQTVSQNLAKQKAGGYRGRRKFLRAQKAAGRVTISKRS